MMNSCDLKYSIRLDADSCSITPKKSEGGISGRGSRFSTMEEVKELNKDSSQISVITQKSKISLKKELMMTGEGGSGMSSLH